MEDADYLIPIVTKAVSNNYYTINTTEQNVTNKTKLREQNIALKVGVHLRSQDAIFGIFYCQSYHHSFEQKSFDLTPKLIPTAQRKVCTLWINLSTCLIGLTESPQFAP